ncbi:saccharopine dehydrogenase family protein [Bosea sp. (in: a-proteobacteria)]|uniref:saccharopine dehydrogenase family protein n=1 Tax=Bosea sp. (in: a-proteobacteria) TaxID=1871050 RepID=UPI002FC6E26F
MVDRAQHGGRPFRVVIVGGGRVGSALALLLKQTAEFEVVVVDPTEPARRRMEELGLPLAEVDPGNAAQIDRLLAEAQAVVAALPSSATPTVAAAARRNGVHYLDLSDDTAGLEAVRHEARAAAGCFIPQCGISPGLVSQLVLDLVSRVGGAPEVDVRIGTLPRQPGNRFGYGLTWDVDALLREYTQPSTALVAGRRTSLAALSELEQLRLGERDYEVFISGNIPASLCARLEGRVERLTSRTIRYPGHLDYMRFLLDDLKLRGRVDLLRNLFLNALPEIVDDRLLISVTATSSARGSTVEERFTREVVSAPIGGRNVSAMRRTAAAHVAAVLDLLRCGVIGEAGLCLQEDIPFSELSQNRFLSWFFESGVAGMDQKIDRSAAS